MTCHGLMIKSIKSYFSVSKKVKIDKTQQTDPGGGGQAEHEDEGRQDIQEPNQVGGDPRPVRGNGTSLFDGTPVGGGGEEHCHRRQKKDTTAKQSQMTKVETRNLSKGMGPLGLRVLLVVEEEKQQRRKKKTGHSRRAS